MEREIFRTLNKTDTDPLVETEVELEIEKNMEAKKLFISRFIEQKLIQVVSESKDKLRNGENVDIVQILKDMWPENDGRKWEQKPKFYIPGLDEDISIRFDNLIDSCGEYDSANKVLYLGVAQIRDAKTEEEINIALLGMLEAIYHEVEHINNPGADLASEDLEEVFNYLNNPGEIMGHARQFAYRYLKEFPGHNFDVDKITELAQRIMNREGRPQMYNYFVALLDPIRIEKYKAYGDTRKIYMSIVEATKKQMGRLTEKSEF